MPKLCNFRQEYGSGSDRTKVAYELWEDTHGKWQGKLTMTVPAAEDAIDVAASISRAIRGLVSEAPGHAQGCDCLLCTEWRLHNAIQRLDD
ncbi:unnamed protein product [marine sediment metagenome]|uniref:Uncharacterized protein n=1 Tax=marine sediment metagenome TaxID=412755 RepID=X0Y298_9ZZZZ